MEKPRYTLEQVYICTFSMNGEKYIQPNLNEYPNLRLCVIDNEDSIAIDINHELKYDYLKIQSMLYFLNDASKKIRIGKRAAIPSSVSYEYDEDKIKKANKIVKKLQKGYVFKDGNEVLGNEEYIKLAEEEALEDIRENEKKYIKGKK